MERKFYLIPLHLYSHPYILYELPILPFILKHFIFFFFICHLTVYLGFHQVPLPLRSSFYACAYRPFLGCIIIIGCWVEIWLISGCGYHLDYVFVNHELDLWVYSICILLGWDKIFRRDFSIFPVYNIHPHRKSCFLVQYAMVGKNVYMRFTYRWCHGDGYQHGLQRGA